MLTFRWFTTPGPRGFHVEGCLARWTNSRSLAGTQVFYLDELCGAGGKFYPFRRGNDSIRATFLLPSLSGYNSPWLQRPWFHHGAGYDILRSAGGGGDGDRSCSTLCPDTGHHVLWHDQCIDNTDLLPVSVNTRLYLKDTSGKCVLCKTVDPTVLPFHLS